MGNKVDLEAYDVTVVDGDDKLDISKELHGRRQIFTGEKEITRKGDGQRVAGHHHG